MIIQIPEHFSNNENILKLSTLSFLYYFNRDSSQKVNVQINNHMLLHIFNGSKIIKNDNKEYEISAKQTLFLSKGQYFMSELLSLEKGCFDGIMVFFDDEFLLSLFSKYPVLMDKTVSEKLADNQLCVVEYSEAVHETMLSTQAYLQRKSNDAVLIQLKFEEIFLQLLQSNRSNEIVSYFQSLYSQSMYKFKNFLENGNFDNVEDMIFKSKLSKVQFRKLFNQLYDTTPKEWLLKKALKKAKKLLIKKELNVTEICYECDFNSLSWFIKSFKKEFGITPKQYQQNC